MGLDLKTIIEQTKLSKKSMIEIQNQSRIFENILFEAVKGAPKKDQKKVEEFRQLQIKVLNLAKEGKINEAQNLIKTFSDGGQNN